LTITSPAEFHLSKIEITCDIVAKREYMKPSLREILADSRIALVAVAVLLLWSFDSVLDALWDPIFSAISFLITAVALLGLPYIPPQFSFSQRSMLISTSFYLLEVLICFAAAWILSHWVYGMSPLRSLKSYGERLARRNHA
jgi:hypothetical protein